MNEYLVETCRRCVPFARVSKNSMVGMLDYADQSFDLVYAFSVFTHLSERTDPRGLQHFAKIHRRRWRIADYRQAETVLASARRRRRRSDDG